MSDINFLNRLRNVHFGLEGLENDETASEKRL